MKLGGGNPKCPTCGKAVYFAEKIHALNKDYHKTCFKCTTCKKTLAAGSASEHEDKPYCKTCYGLQFSHAGYGFGGSLASYQEHGGAESQVIKSEVYEGGYYCSCGEPVSPSTAFCGKCGLKLR